MNDSNYIKIFTGDFLIVQRIVSDLEKTDINAVIKDETESGRLAGFGPTIPGYQEILVHKDEVDKAILVVEQITYELQN